MITKQKNNYNSSTVTRSCYFFDSKELYVEFNQTTYLYKNVSLADYKAFAMAESQGKALNKFIKGKYNYEKVEDLNLENTQNE